MHASSLDLTRNLRCPPVFRRRSGAGTANATGIPQSGGAIPCQGWPPALPAVAHWQIGDREASDPDADLPQLLSHNVPLGVDEEFIPPPDIMVLKHEDIDLEDEEVFMQSAENYASARRYRQELIHEYEDDI